MSQGGILQWQAIEFGVTGVSSGASQDLFRLIMEKRRGEVQKNETLTQEEKMKGKNNY
jgi:hypothetical protein